MPNKWIDHVQKYAKSHDIAYGCALNQPDIKEGYVKVVKKTKKQINEEKLNIMISQNIEMLKNKIKNMTDDEIPIIKMKVNSYNKTVRDGLKEKYPNYYNKLYS